MDSSLRYLAPKEHDKICELFSKYPCVYPGLETHINILKILKMAPRYLTLLEKLETFIIKKAGFNFVLRNIPDYGELCETGQRSKVGYAEVRDTLNQFGKVIQLEIIRGTVYAKFEDPTRCHKLINNMQMGTNIITTRILC